MVTSLLLIVACWCIVQQVAVLCPDLSDDHSHLGLQAVNDDLAIGISGIDTGAVTHHCAIGLSDLELNALQRLASGTILLQDLQGTQRLVQKLHNGDVITLND